MSHLSVAIRNYPAVAATLVVALFGLVSLAMPAPLTHAAPFVIGAYALIVAAWQAISMVRKLLKGNAGLDILAVMAITAAVLVGEPWAALVVVLMLTGGEALEDYAQNRSRRELDALLNRAPRQATRVLTPAGASSEELETISIDEVKLGDTLLVRPGELVPVDAELLSTDAEFDESSLTGESLPVHHAQGDSIASGVVNGTTAVHLRATALAADSQYQQIVALVEVAQQSKAKAVRLADRYAVPFTLVSVAIAAIAWVASGDPVRFAEVLVVATPCPLLIAAPVAFLGGMSRAARAGLIVKGGSTLEQLARVRSVAFDKTGTLTTGHPELERVEPASGHSAEEVLQLAATAEVYSSHVLAAAVITTAEKANLTPLPVETAAESATNGVEATLSPSSSELATAPTSKEAEHLNRGLIRVGKPSWVGQFAPDLRQVELNPGELAIYVARDGHYVGALIMRDGLRPDALATITELRELGLERMLVVTGDVAKTARPIAAALGIAEVHAECRPQDKVRIVAEVQPRPLLMAGDGLNDAPVLAAADVGFAMGARGATAASESAAVVNRFDSLASLSTAVRIGQDTVRIALQSIWLGIAISVGLMLVAAFGFLPALLGAWMQEAVDLVAILWALRTIAPKSKRQRSAPPQTPTREAPTRQSSPAPHAEAT
ncbi:heavy metal translocating P-type ATPase [Leucobacter coleopterorum]|uniref:Heavy metal translocating P-type ATPase n=1 Tax=Leucobacter coleopterorum TaxID=2714933 RepID=A0ABX6JXD5_9MICO|nr:heavy metal translocating P-type ATPase [Leucobacter coleopterorum]QIM18971.1 heavy metal translocating P-type ATPase [Leucobacter coleopterorum]